MPSLMHATWKNNIMTWVYTTVIVSIIWSLYIIQEISPLCISHLHKNNCPRLHNQIDGLLVASLFLSISITKRSFGGRKRVQ